MTEQESLKRWPRWFASVRSLARNKAFLLILFGDIFVGLAFEIIDYPLIIYLVSLNYETVIIGRLISGGLVAMAIAQIPAGLLIDRIGRKNGILLGLCLYSIFPALYPFAVEFSSFLAIAMVSGVASAILTPASITFVAEIVSREMRGQAMALAYFTSGILTFGPFVGAALYTVHRIMPFVVCSAMTIMTTVVFFIFLPQSKASNAEVKDTAEVKKLTRVLKKPLLGIFLAGFAYSFAAGILFLLIPIFFLEVLKESILQTGLALVVPQIVCFVSSLLLGGWMDRKKEKKRLLVLGLIGCGMVALAFTMVTTSLEAVLAWTLLMLTGILIGSSSTTMIAEFSEESFRATAMSVYSLFGTFGVVTGLQFIGDLQNTKLSSQTMFYLIPALCALTTLIVSITVKESK